MLEEMFNELSSLPAEETVSLFVTAGKNLINTHKSAFEWKKIFVDTGKFFIENEQNADVFFDDLANILSKKNMTHIASDLKDVNGYQLKEKLWNSMMELMDKYEIPHDIAVSYSFRIISTILEQIQIMNPQKYDQAFQKEWREEQKEYLEKINTKIEIVTTELLKYKQEGLKVYSSDIVDLDLKRSTENPSIGIDFFTVDDMSFRQVFEEKRYDECIYVKGKCQEETIYCIINELWRLQDNRAAFVVESPEDWERLRNINVSGNIYIPRFYADEITAIEGNTNIFVFTENTPCFKPEVIEMRPRTLHTISDSLQRCGADIETASHLISDTHGLYIPMKKKILKGSYQKMPQWMDNLSDKTKKIVLLLGQWEDVEGDKAIIESLSGKQYENFVEELQPYAKGEDPFIHVVKRHQELYYCLASVENTWEYLDISLDDPLWEQFTDIFIDVLNESENLFLYSAQEKLLAKIKGEKLFWSATIRKGMIRTLIMKAFYKKDEECQNALNILVEKILSYIDSTEKWKYISNFFVDLCEISPNAVLKRLENEFISSTGLLQLFEKQSEDILFGRNEYTSILFGVDEFLVQSEYVMRGLQWILKLNNLSYTYKSNAPKDTLDKVFCTWCNFSALQSVEEKKNAAEMAISIDRNAWDYLYDALPGQKDSMFGEISSPKYRDHVRTTSPNRNEINELSMDYLKLLLKHMEFSTEKWIKILKITDILHDDLCNDIFDKMLCELVQMTDSEVMIIKNAVRDLIYRHRYFSSASWAMSEKKLVKYECLLDKIHTEKAEYEYAYLFKQEYDFPLLHPIPYHQEGRYDENRKAVQQLIQQKLKEFQRNGYTLNVLAEACSNENSTTLGQYMSLYWHEGIFDELAFKILINAQSSGTMALDYVRGFSQRGISLFPDILDIAMQEKCSNDVIVGLYRIEAMYADDIPLIQNADYIIKELFWKIPTSWMNINYKWALSECKQYGSLTSYIFILYNAKDKGILNEEEIFFYLNDIEKMPRKDNTQMTDYYIKEILKFLQEKYMYDSAKCERIAAIEMSFFPYLDWEDMRCFDRSMKKTPDLFAELISIVYKKDNEEKKELTEEESNYINALYRLYDMSHFCPAEDKECVNEIEIMDWVKKFEELLKVNHQSRLFGFLLGRLLAFSPVGEDGYKPCEAVRKVIERYGNNERMLSSYKTTIYNMRGIYSPTAGIGEMEIAERYRESAEYLKVKYPKTAQIYYDLFHQYKHEADRERRDAENGWY